MAALIALSERKRVSYDVLQGLSTVDTLYVEHRKKKRSEVIYMGFYVSGLFFSKQEDLHTFLFCFDTANFVFPA